MNIDHLREFLALAKTRSYQRTSAELNVSQPALSKHIQQMEREVGFAVFERMPQGVRVTREGQEFFKSAARFLSEFDGAVASIREQGGKGQWRQSEVVVESNRVSPLIRKLTSLATIRASKELPSLSVVYRSDVLMVDDALVRDAVGLLRRGEADVAIAHVARSSKMRKACEVRRLLKEPLCAVLAAGDELSSRESLAFSDIRDRTFLDFEVHPGCTESVFEAFADEVGEKPKKRYLHLLASQSEIPLILESIEPGQVYVLARSVMGEADNGRREGVPYAVVPLVGDAAFVEVCALSRADENRACVREYLDVLVAAAAELERAGEPMAADR